ncbi:DUF928 domain-containing protein [Tumidithrix elongata RA019]|uniref:DUF928 domain-containing protein n=1 Tax=Tumidithrix elongata BACA0141 TaxID=2716417 RepID=A0AAW9PTB9_9CYAN|nr:DUF928 domain-containing protein [Tumidithrix elongata RA019]
MFTFKQPIKSLRPALILGTLCLSTLVGTVAITSTVEAQRGQSYGLGMSGSSVQGGAIRGDLPSVLLLVPPDGARTLSARPTLYWYVSANENENRSGFKMRLYLRENPTQEAKNLFDVQGSGKEVGLYKFTLPSSAPSLVEGKVQRLQLRWKRGLDDVNLNALVLLDKDPKVVKALSESSSGLEKARILAKERYWYDALDAYSQWIEAHPKDDVAIKERKALLTEGLNLKSNEQDPEKKKKADENIQMLLCKISQSSTPLQIKLP